MSDVAGFTPSLDELRRIYVDATAGHREEDPDEAERGAEFDRAVAAQRAVALRDAAESYVYVHAVQRTQSRVYQWLRARANALTAPTMQPTTPETAEVLARHVWFTTRWGDGRGGHSWRCSCEKSNEAFRGRERFARYDTELEASLAAAAHIAAEVRGSEGRES